MILNSRKMLDRPRIAYIPKGLTVDYEKEYARFFDQEVNYVPENREDFLCQFRLLNRWAGEVGTASHWNGPARCCLRYCD